ncbi:hypothetical protein ABEB36_012069 [Hypothenemus hampei]|uniref:O-acyltransferase WSD1 C-terminal domain-containing protein n=1 Tax=Hypothenemus hampei TaxID=57062 RepID=A0ABD1EA16_HYPHA
MVLTLLDLLLSLLVIPLYPVIAIVYLLLSIQRQLINLWLAYTLGDQQFGGLLSAFDRLFAVVPNANSGKTVLVVNYVKSDKEIDLLNRFQKILENQVFNQPTKFKKLTSTWNTFLGQPYLIKNQVQISDVVKTIPLPCFGEAFDDNYMKKFVGQASNLPLPKNDKALWEIYIGTRHLENMDPNLKGYVYPIFMRFHHLVADGMRLMPFLSQLAESNIFETFQIQEPPSINFMVKIAYCFYILFISPITYLKFSFWRKVDENPLHGTKLSREKLIAWATDGSSQHVKTIKKIKNRLPNTRFTDVLYACISSSFFHYFQKKNLRIPKTISVLSPRLLRLSLNDQEVLKNDFTFTSLELPIVNPQNFLADMEKVKLSMDEMRRSPGKDVLYWINYYFAALIPTTILSLISTTKTYSCFISNLPGSQNKVKCFGDCELLAGFPSAINSNETGMTLTIITFNNQFFISLFVDKATIHQQEDAQFIVDDIIRNMDIFNEKVQKTFILKNK